MSQPGSSDSECIECVMAWLLYGDGAKCLAGHGRVYWKVRAADE